MVDANLVAGVREANVQRVKNALNAGANPNTEFNSYTVLCYSIEDLLDSKGVRIIDLLLKAGADPNLKTFDTSPLEFAVQPLYKFYRDNPDRYVNPVEYEKSHKEVLEFLCPVTDVEIIKEVNEKYPELVESCLSKSATARVEPAMKALEAQTNKSYRAPPGTYDVPPGFSESVGDYAFGIKTPRPSAGKRKNKKKTNKRRKTTKRRRTLKK